MSQIRTALISTLLPAGVASAEQSGPHSGKLLQEEWDALGAAVAVRQMEFAAGRSCARAALRILGLPESPILRGARREPLWPPGVIGSITHCKGYCAAAVTYSDQVPSLGIDAEPDEPLPDGILAAIAVKEEIEQLGKGRLTSRGNLDRLLFSAKESTYKAWYPMTNRWLDFTSVRIDIAAEGDCFDVALLDASWPEGRCFRLAGRYLMRGGLILTAVLAERIP